MVRNKTYEEELLHNTNEMGLYKQKEKHIMKNIINDSYNILLDLRSRKSGHDRFSKRRQI